MGPESNFDFEAELQRYEALLHMADLLVRHRGLDELFRELFGRLHQFTSFEMATVSFHDPARNVMQVHILEGCDQALVHDEKPVADLPSGWVWLNQRPLVVSDIDVQARFPKVAHLITERGLRSSCLLPLTTGQRKLGAMGFASIRADAYGENDVRFLQRVAGLVALAVENALTHSALQEEKERLQMLLEVNATLVSSRDLQELFPAISGYIRKVVNHDFGSIALYDEKLQALRVYALDYPHGQKLAVPGEVLSLKDSGPGRAFLQREVRAYKHPELLEFKGEILGRLLQQGVRSTCYVPLITHKGPLGTLNLASKQDDAFLPEDLGLLKQVAAQVAVALDNANAYRQIAELKDKLAEEKLYLQGEIRSELNFGEIVGDSPTLERILEQAKTVAPSDATVLILGETGTGKELMARAIHRMSSRKDSSFIKVNCAAIPTGLLESELFGHEKGAFTGAISQKIGRLELADKGTLFLDEVGDIPLELQPKLLRVLQDQEFERLGSNRTLKVNIRLVAATNRDLESRVAENEFRSDLYYRLNVFPLRMPALRERREDIPLLVRYFTQKFARRMNKQIESVPARTMDSLVHWDWPGNIRELENFIERSVILTPGSTLMAPPLEMPVSARRVERPETLENLEREHILRVLRETGGVIAGMRGAAARLGLKRTTLQSRMQRMGISRREYEN